MPAEQASGRVVRRQWFRGNMALTSSLYNGLSGLTVNQMRLNVIGNNIANVNTVGFKSSRVLFKPQFYVTDTAGTPPDGTTGGTNPNQRGLGADVAAIQKNFAPGSIDPTGVATDLAIDGNGFFMVSRGTDTFFTRDGSFLLNEANELVTSRGEYVMGYGTDANFNINGQLGRVTLPLGALTIAEATRGVLYKGNLNSDGPVSSGASVLTSQPLTVVGGAATPDANTLLTDLRLAATPTGAPLFTVGQTVTPDITRGGRSTNAPGFEVTATSTLGEFMDYLRFAGQIDTSAAVVAAAPAGYTPGASIGASLIGDPANSVRVNLTGNVGSENAIDIDGGLPFLFEPDSSSNAVGESKHTIVTAYDSLGSPLQLEITVALESKDSGGTTWRFWVNSTDDTNFLAYDGTTDAGAAIGTGTLSFDTNGRLVASTGTTISIAREDTGANPQLNISLDFSDMTSLADSISTLQADRRAEDAGFPTGTLADFSIGSDGVIVGNFTNGLQRSLGQIALAQFDNAQGLIDQGGGNYKTGPSSGQPIITVPGQFGVGLIRSGALEQSNVDISREFINMIITTTGFSASSRVIQTSDRLLTELLNSAR